MNKSIRAVITDVAASSPFLVKIFPTHQRCLQLLEARDGQGRRAAEVCVEAVSLSEKMRQSLIVSFMSAGLDLMAKHPRTGETLLHCCVRYGGMHNTSVTDHGSSTSG